MDILRRFYDCDEFCQEFVPYLQARQVTQGRGSRQRETTLSVSEVRTILILLQTSGFRNFKTSYLPHGCQHLTRAFPHLGSYSRFVEWEAEALLPLAAFLATRFGQCTGLSFLDSPPRKVCHTLRIKSHQVFTGMARRGVSRTGWFYGCTVPLVITDPGDLLAALFILATGRIASRCPSSPAACSASWSGSAVTSRTTSLRGSGGKACT